MLLQQTKHNLEPLPHCQVVLVFQVVLFLKVVVEVVQEMLGRIQELHQHMQLILVVLVVVP
tara:strand:- start:686 stop:868 length:183 start_codon:yes stop_codon:yes gene_type:complete